MITIQTNHKYEIDRDRHWLKAYITWASYVSLALLLSACESNECGDVGDPCVLSCQPTERATCVTSKICACVYQGEDVGAGESGGMSGGETSGGMSGGASGGGIIGPLECDPPEPGELVLNEVMIDPEGDENLYEFVEIANLADRPVDLTGIKLLYNDSEKVTFVSGCMEARSLGALYASEDEWVWSSPAGGVAAMKKSFRFSNGGDFQFTLVASNGAELGQISGGSDLIAEGVSLNRDPDFTGEVVRRHSELSTLPSSPAQCSNGGRLEEGCTEPVTAGMTAGSDTGGDAGGAGSVAGTESTSCAPPQRGDLIINEVMIDPIGDENSGEFIEIINLNAEARSLAGVRVIYNGRDKVTFSAGCMPGHSVGVLYSTGAEVTWSAPVPGLEYERSSFRLSNSSDFAFALLYLEESLSELIGPSSLVTEGVSINRDPDADPETMTVALHSAIAPGVNMSPGLCAGGDEPTGSCPEIVTAGMTAGEEAGVMAGAVAGAVAGMMTSGMMAGEGAGVEPTPLCDPPIRGDLIINEVMIDPLGDENSGEFIEIMNLNPEPRSLAGIRITYNGNDKVTFSAGCMPGHSVGVLYSTGSEFTWSAPVPDLEYERRALRLSNVADFVFTLSDPEDTLSELRGSAELTLEGVSLNRSPDADHDAVDVVRHSTLAPGVDASPGQCALGGELAEGCPPPIVADMGMGDMELTDMALGDMEMGDMAMGDMAMGDMAMGDMAMGDMAMGDMAMGDMELTDMAMGDMTMGDMAMGDMAMGDMTPGGMEMGDMAMGDMAMGGCVTPIASGDLLINEALVNPDGNELVDDSEWIEIVNRGDEPISLEGVSLWNEGELKVSFAPLCVMPHSALTLYNLRGPDAWVWSTPPLGDVSAQVAATFSLTNSRPIALELKLGGVPLSALSAPSSVIESGVSANRNPDATPDGAVVKHNEVESAVGTSSPGRCANGERYEDLCLTP